MKVALCVIATGKYRHFVGQLIDSADLHFVPGHEVEYFAFADCPPFSGRDPERRQINFYPTDHAPWPLPTLKRYHHILRAAGHLAAFDYIYYIDVDMQMVRTVGEEIFGDLVATIHPGYCESPRHAFTYETRRDSRACIKFPQGHRYYAGAFQGGRSSIYLAAMRDLVEAIDDDASRGITAVWHDESHWNRYLVDHPPTVELSHEYCCPDGWRKDTQKIIIIGKNAAEWRT